MRRTWISMLMAISVAVAACSSAEADQVATLSEAPDEVAAETDVPTTQDEDQEALNEFAACMRDNGVDGFEDPVVNADGSVDFGANGGQVGAEDRDVLQAAFEECGDLIEGLSIAPGDGDFDVTEIEDQLVAFAACMRDEGIDMDDPDLSNFGPGGGGQGDGAAGGGPFGDLDLDDPGVQAAFEACQGEFGFGPGGGGPGGPGQG